MRTKRGFLLLEVMASIVIITGGLLFVIRVYSTARMALERSHALLKNSLLLEEKIFDFEERGVIEEGKGQGHFPGSNDYFWEVEADTLAFQGLELSDLCTVKLDVLHKQDYSQTGAPEKYSLFTYLNKKK